MPASSTAGITTKKIRMVKTDLDNDEVRFKKAQSIPEFYPILTVF
jgi:hypothetical protein